MSSDPDDRINWLRLTAEACAIVFSILLAFALDAWWDARAEARSERNVLMTLAQELDAADVQLQMQLGNYVFLEKATETVADQLVAAGDGQSVAVPDAYLAALLLDMTYNPPIGTTNTLLASGQVSMLRNWELRVALAEWPAVIQDAVEEQTALWRLGDERLEPLLHQAILNLAPAYQILTGYEQHRQIVVKESGESSVVSSPELWNILYQRLTFLKGGRNELEVAEKHLKRMVAIVRQELG
jgi:hypothetical protein